MNRGYDPYTGGRNVVGADLFNRVEPAENWIQIGDGANNANNENAGARIGVLHDPNGANNAVQIVNGANGANNANNANNANAGVAIGYGANANTANTSHSVVIGGGDNCCARCKIYHPMKNISLMDCVADLFYYHDPFICQKLFNVITEHIIERDAERLCKDYYGNHKWRTLINENEFNFANYNLLVNHLFLSSGTPKVLNKYGFLLYAEEIETIVEERSSYSCVVCGKKYGCIPTNQIIKSHIGVCLLKTLNSLRIGREILESPDTKIKKWILDA